MKHRLPTLFAGLVAALVVVGTSIGINLQPVAVIELVSWSPQEIHDEELDQPVSAGLSVVGVEERVYLRGLDGEGGEVTSYMWNIISAPDGSTAAIDPADAEETSFIPDVAGRYEVELTVMTADGSATTTQMITAAEYVGVGTVGGLSPDVGAGQCAVCHAGNTAEWMETGHSTFFERAIDGLASDHYNGECISLSRSRISRGCRKRRIRRCRGSSWLDFPRLARRGQLGGYGHELPGTGSSGQHPV